jgi:hypothetical protein
MSADIIDVEAARAARDAKRAEEAIPEIAAEIREFRREHDPSPPEDAPITLAEIARTALERYQVARRAAENLWREQRKAAGEPRRRSVFSAPDPSRPWDVSDRAAEDHQARACSRPASPVSPQRSGSV